jgi:hypothetical protein
MLERKPKHLRGLRLGGDYGDPPEEEAWGPPPWAESEPGSDLRSRLGAWWRARGLNHWLLVRLVSVLNILFIVAALLAIPGGGTAAPVIFSLLALALSGFHLWLTWWEM